MNGFDSIFGMLCDFSDEGVSAVLNFFKERVQNAKFQQDIDIALKNYKGGEKALENDLKAFISISLAPEKEEKLKKKIGKLEAKGKTVKPSVSDYLDFFYVRTADEITAEFVTFKAKDNIVLDENSKKAFNDIILLSRKALVESYQSMISNESKAIIVTLTDMFEKFANTNAKTSLYQTFYDVPEVCPECTSDDFYIDKEHFICKSCGKKINLNSLSTKKTTLDVLHQSLSQSMDDIHKDTLAAIEKSQNTIINTLSEAIYESEESVVGAIYETEEATLDAIDSLSDKIDALSDKIDSRVSSQVDSKIDKFEVRTIEAIEKSNEKVLEAVYAADNNNKELSAEIIDSNKASEEETRKVIHSENELTRDSIAGVVQQLNEIQKTMELFKENSDSLNSGKKRKPRRDNDSSNVATATIENDNELDAPDEDEFFEDFDDYDDLEEECKETVSGVYTRNGVKILFGSYPQTRVTNENLIAILNKKAGALPFNNQSQTWTSYGYYVNNKVTDFMWYRDITHGAKKYRGVYFTAQRPSTTQSYALGNYSFQDECGYDFGKVYWFKFEPLSWTVISEDTANKTALILCDNIIDSREYYASMSSRRINGNLVYPCSYEHSTLRNWLNDSFYNTAFTSPQQMFVQSKIIESAPADTVSSFNSPFSNKLKRFEQTEDKVFVLSYSEVNSGASGLLSVNRQNNLMYQKKASDYAQSQGLYTQHSNGEWWLRSSSFGCNSNFVCIIDTNGYSVNSGCSVDRTDKGVVPALYIKF